MASPSVVDFDRLLAPIPGDCPSGKDPRRDTTINGDFAELLQSRNQSIEAEKDPIDVTGQERRSQWETVSSLAEKLLEQSCKDGKIAVWYVEALLRKAGYAGLRDGLQFAHRMLADFWDTMHADTNSPEARVRPFRELGKKQFWDRLPEIPVSSSLGETARVHCEVLRDDIDGCLQELSELQQVMTARGGEGVPSLDELRKKLVERRLAAHRLCEDCAKELQGDQQADSTEHPQAATGTTRPSSSGAIRSRAEAFQALAAAADYFERTEPHSPLSYLLRQARRWGGLKLHELLAEVVPDDGQRAELFRRFGVEFSSDKISEPE